MRIKNIYQWLTLATIISFVYLRLSTYGNLYSSVAMTDTLSYVNSSKVNLLSWKAFTSYRPYTTNVIYNLFTPEKDYPNTVLDTQFDTTRRGIYDGFGQIALAQSVISVIAWASLVWVISLKINSGILKIVTSIVILCLGFTPQIADWDSVMSSESLSISLFILSLAILIWLSTSFYEAPDSGWRKILGVCLLITTLFFWLFTRDVNVYSLALLCIFIGGIYIFPIYRKIKLPFVIVILLIGLLLFGGISAKQRPLWVKALEHVWTHDILTSKGVSNWFTQKGMPTPNTPEYPQWFIKHAQTKYMQFLIEHPIYTTQKLFKDTDKAFGENMQPYFRANELPYRNTLTLVGNYINSKGGISLLVSIGLLFIFWHYSFIQKNSYFYPWAWLFTWTFLTAFTTLFLTIFGDTNGLVRHALSSTITFKLLMWMGLLIIADNSLSKSWKQ